MSVLLLDAGHSRLKWAWVRDGEFSFGGVISHSEFEVRCTDDSFEVMDAGAPSPQEIYIASVASDEVFDRVAFYCKKKWEIEPCRLQAGRSACGVVNGYIAPGTLGVDRWLAMLAARNLLEARGRTICVIDCGTAVTIDVLRHDGQHLGGWIAPGVALMLRAITDKMGLVPENAKSHASKPDLLARSTGQGVLLGCRQAVAGQVMQAVAASGGAQDIQPLCVLTGGDAGNIAPLLGIEALIRNDLVLQGMRLQLQCLGEESRR